MSEIAVNDEPEVLVRLDQMSAERLDKRVRLMAGTARNNLENVGRLLDEAKAGQIHEVLGFKSWTAYVADAVGGQLQLSGETRTAMVQLLADEGMSVRAIATATGVSKSTVARDLEEVSHDGTPDAESTVPQWDSSPQPSETTMGLDGKTRRKPKPRPKPDEPPSGPNPRKVIERMAPRIDGMAMALEGLDPNEVDPNAMERQVGMIRGAVVPIIRFINAISPPKPEPVVEAEPTRKPQIRTVYRGAVSEMDVLMQQLYQLTSDSRWEKASFTEKDVQAVGLIITGLGQIRDRMEKNPDAGSAEPGAAIDAAAIVAQSEVSGGE